MGGAVLKHIKQEAIFIIINSSRQIERGIELNAIYMFLFITYVDVCYGFRLPGEQFASYQNNRNS